MIPADCLRKPTKGEETIDQAERTLTRSVVYRMMKELFRKLRFGHAEAIGSWYRDYQNPKLFDPAHGLGVFLDEASEEVNTAFERVFQALSAYRRVCNRYQLNCMTILFSQRFQVQPKDWERTVARYRLNESCFDLDRPNRLILEWCDAIKLGCADPTEAMQQVHQDTNKSLFLPSGDMHWNPRGHQALAESTVEGLKSRLVSKSSQLAKRRAFQLC